MNKVLKYLIFSDIILFTGLGLVTPILAVFIADDVQGGNIFYAGLASTIFLITYAILQIIFSYLFKPKDRYWMLLLGTGLIAIVPFGYIFVKHIWLVFVLQFIHGIGAGFSYPSWSSLFTANLEKGKRGFQYSLYSSGVGIGSAITATAGALIAQKFSFELVFLLTGIFALIGVVILLFMNKKEALRKI